MNFRTWLEGQQYLHTVGFMPGSNASVIGVMLKGQLLSATGLIFLRPSSFAQHLEGTADAPDTLWIELGRNPKLLTARNRDELMGTLGLSGHTDDPAVASNVARRLRELGYDGYERLDFPEIAVLSDLPHRIVGRLEGDFYPPGYRPQRMKKPGQPDGRG